MPDESMVLDCIAVLRIDRENLIFGEPDMYAFTRHFVARSGRSHTQFADVFSSRRLLRVPCTPCCRSRCSVEVSAYWALTVPGVIVQHRTASSATGTLQFGSRRSS